MHTLTCILGRKPGGAGVVAVVVAVVVVVVVVVAVVVVVVVVAIVVVVVVVVVAVVVVAAVVEATVRIAQCRRHALLQLPVDLTASVFLNVSAGVLVMRTLLLRSI